LQIKSNQILQGVFEMRISAAVFAIFVSSALAAGPCDPDSDSCRAVINASACFNEFMGNKNSILGCLTGTEGSASPKDKVSGLA
jgi:hypothetical protein